MKYTAILNGKERELEIIQLDTDQYRVIVDGKTYDIDTKYNSSYWISLLINNHSYDVSFSFEGDTLELNFWNHFYNIEVLDERKIRMRKIQSSLELSGPEMIKTSMPGKVIKILVKEGEKVKPGTGIIIIEAMKMENEIQCRNAGVVKAVHVKGGQVIESDVPLVEIDP